MSSINFTGLKSIKIGSGSTEATVYFRGTKLWPSVISPTFAVVDDIKAYTDTTYVDVYDKKTSSWYKLNDLKVYEKYGIYEKVTTLDRAVFVEKGCDVDLNNQWRKSTYWSQTDYTCYESNSNYNVNNSYSSMKVIIPEGMSSVTVYFGSYAESTYDYSVLWQLDKNKPTSNPDDTTSGVVASSKGKQGSKIAYTYKISDTSKSHFFWITYRKDTSNNSNNDRGYLLIKQDIITGTTVYPDKLVIYNNDEYRWNDNQWLELGSITNEYPFEYPEKDTPPTVISFNSVAERDAYTEVYNGLVCQVGDDYYKYIDGNWIDYTMIFMVNNTQYNNGEWKLDSDIYSSTTYNVVSDLDFNIHCEWYQYGGNEYINLIVDNNIVATSKSGSTPIDYSLKAGTYVIKLDLSKVYNGSNGTHYLKNKTYMKVKR
jgi:hypothetical protein